MSFLEHLEALRWHLIRSVSVVVGLGIVAFIWKDFVFDTLILAPTRPDFFTNRLLCSLGEWLQVSGLCINQIPLHLQNISMSGQFTTHFTISFLLGAIASFPYLFYEFWRFIRPALYVHEARHARGAVWAASSLFTVGILFAYYLIVPLSVDFLGNYKVSDQVENIVNLQSYISTFSSILLSGGAVFELPVFIFFLAKIGVVSSAFLKQYRRHAIVVIVIFAAVITPPDVVSQLMVTLPLVLLYELSIFLARGIERKRQRA